MTNRVLITSIAAMAALAAVPAKAVFPVYTNVGTENPAEYSVAAGNTGFLRSFFVGKGGAAFTVTLGAFVDGVDRGFGFDNQSATFGQMHNFGAIVAGQSISYYVFVQDTGDTFFLDKALNGDGIQHFYRASYSGTDFGPLISGGYYGVEDLFGGGDFNYSDLQFVSTTGSIGAIPEPGSWALMILGFGVVGSAMRRHKVRVSFA